MAEALCKSNYRKARLRRHVKSRDGAYSEVKHKDSILRAGKPTAVFIVPVEALWNQASPFCCLLSIIVVFLVLLFIHIGLAAQAAFTDMSRHASDLGNHCCAT